MDYKVIIGLPAYNEELSIAKLLDKIIKLKDVFGEGLEVIIVNDGSKDKTESILKKYSDKFKYINYINHPQNMGLGRAMNTLITHVTQNFAGSDILVTLDADNTHNPKIIPAMIEQLNKNKLDIVIASRFTPGGEEMGLTVLRKTYSRGAMMFCKCLYPIKNVNDYSCGFRAYNIGFLQKVLKAYDGNIVTVNGFECMVEILARCGKVGVKAGEYPLVLEYNLKEGISKMNVSKTILGYLRLVRKIKKPINRTV